MNEYIFESHTHWCWTNATFVCRGENITSFGNYFPVCLLLQIVSHPSGKPQSHNRMQTVLKFHLAFSHPESTISFNHCWTTCGVEDIHFPQSDNCANYDISINLPLCANWDRVSFPPFTNHHTWISEIYCNLIGPFGAHVNHWRITIYPTRINSLEEENPLGTQLGE